MLPLSLLFLANTCRLLSLLSYYPPIVDPNAIFVYSPPPSSTLFVLPVLWTVFNRSQFSAMCMTLLWKYLTPSAACVVCSQHVLGAAHNTSEVLSTTSQPLLFAVLSFNNFTLHYCLISPLSLAVPPAWPPLLELALLPRTHTLHSSLSSLIVLPFHTDRNLCNGHCLTDHSSSRPAAAADLHSFI